MAWVVVGSIGCLALLFSATLISATEQGPAARPPRPSNFSITKAESSGYDEVQIVYIKKDCFLTGVNTSVTFLSASRTESVVEMFWPKWRAGEQKTYTSDACNLEPIREVRLSGTAKEHSFQNGKEIIRRVTFAERKRFPLEAPILGSPYAKLTNAP